MCSLAADIGENGGAVLGTYFEPLGGTPVILAALPIDPGGSPSLTSGIPPNRTSSGS